MRLDPDIVKRQLQHLFLLYPDLVEDDEAWALTILSETDAVELLRSIERRRQEAASMAGAIASNIAELQLRQERFERREKAMRGLAFEIMQAAGLKKQELPEATYSIRNGQQKLIGDAPLASLNTDYIRTTSEPNRSKIKEALQNGATIHGFTLSNAEPSLSIRTK